MQASFHIYSGRSTERLGQKSHIGASESGERWRNKNCTASYSESLTANLSVSILLTLSKALFTSPLQKNWKNPTVTRTTTWKGINPPGNGIPGAAESPNSRAKPVPDLHLFGLCRQSMAMLIFVRRRTAKQLLFLSPPLPSKVTEDGLC